MSLISNMKDSLRTKLSKSENSNLSGDNPWAIDEGNLSSTSVGNATSTARKRADSKESSVDAPADLVSSAQSVTNVSAGGDAVAEPAPAPKKMVKKKKVVKKAAAEPTEQAEVTKSPPLTNGKSATAEPASFADTSSQSEKESKDIVGSPLQMSPSLSLRTAPRNPFKSTSPTHTRTPSSTVVNGTSTRSITSNPARYSPAVAGGGKLFNKVIILTHGCSGIGKALIRGFHKNGARVVFGDTNRDAAKRLVNSCGPPDTLHYNYCDLRKYTDILDLFKLALSLYGRIDAAIYGVGDDGSHAGSISDGERFAQFSDPNKTSKQMIDEVEAEFSDNDVGDLLAAPLRFSKIALAYLKHSKSIHKQSTGNKPRRITYHSGINYMSTNSIDKSLTFVTSVASFSSVTGLPFYQMSQHSVLGLVRSLKTDIDPMKDGIRVNAVITDMMIPRAIAKTGGRMSVQIPKDDSEAVSKVIAGIVTASADPDNENDGSHDGATGTGVWYEKGSQKGVVEQFMHGRAWYVVGGESWDLFEGLDRSRSAWLGTKPSDALERNLHAGDGMTQWMLDLS